MKADSLKFYNGYGGFDTHAGEYVILRRPPLPWINCISSVEGEPFGFLISDSGGGYVWHGNSRENPITRWYCDVANDASDEKIVLKKHAGQGVVEWSPFEDCVARHGFGYSCFEGQRYGIHWLISAFVPIGSPVKVTLLEICAECDCEISVEYKVDSPYKHSFIFEKNLQKWKIKQNETSKFVLLLAQKEKYFGSYTQLAACEEALEKVKNYWHEYLDRIKISTPDESINVIMNGWLQYQTVSCRMNGRTAFYQCGGAYGFRDQLQDCLAIIYTDSAKVRQRILEHASRQYEEGDVQHWWHPPKNVGIRSRYSDDMLWLVYVTYKYVEATGDKDILSVRVPYIKSRPLDDSEIDRYEEPEISDKEDSLFDHCVLACRYAQKYGEHGIPLIGGGDWNDGMNRVGIRGKGESIWLGWFLCCCLECLCKLAFMTNISKIDRNKIIAEAKNISSAIEKHGWDGKWYVRAYCDSGRVLGSANSSECIIDSIAQSWAVLSGFGDRERCKKALNSAEHFLADYENGIIKLLTPPFTADSIKDVGYIASYPPGIRENGAQYTHAAVWLAKAFLKVGIIDKSYKIISAINPVNHTRTELEVAKYKIEPYVAAADIYSDSNAGRGGWSWYTGSAAWFYSVIFEDLLGIRVRNSENREKSSAELIINPSMPKDWKECTVEYKYKSTKYIITIGSKGKYPQTVKIKDDGAVHRINCC